MKLALLISGMYRTHDYVIESWKPILDLNPSVFYTTWDINESSYKDYTRYNSVLSPVDLIKKHPTAKIDVREHNLYQFRNNGQRMFFLWVCSVRNMLASNVDYDAVILTRPDIKLEFAPNLNLEEFLFNLEDDTIYVIDFEARDPNSVEGYYDSISNDTFFLGKKTAIKKLISPKIKSLMYDEFNFPIIDCIHFHIRSLFTEVGLKIVVIDNICYNLIRFSEFEKD